VDRGASMGCELRHLTNSICSGPGPSSFLQQGVSRRHIQRFNTHRASALFTVSELKNVLGTTGFTRSGIKCLYTALLTSHRHRASAITHRLVSRRQDFSQSALCLSSEQHPKPCLVGLGHITLLKAVTYEVQNSRHRDQNVDTPQVQATENTLLMLPPELRNVIYELALTEDQNRLAEQRLCRYPTTRQETVRETRATTTAKHVQANPSRSIANLLHQQRIYSRFPPPDRITTDALVPDFRLQQLPAPRSR